MRITKRIIELQPCPFCGQIPILIGEELHDVVSGAWKSAYGLRMQCEFSCVLGRAWLLAYGDSGGCCYISPEAAAKAWNSRCAGSAYVRLYEGMRESRDKALTRLCDWCGVCPEDRRDPLDCEIADLGNLGTSPDQAAEQSDRPTHDEQGHLLIYPSNGGGEAES